jgi:hypothetical protein
MPFGLHRRPDHPPGNPGRRRHRSKSGPDDQRVEPADCSDGDQNPHSCPQPCPGWHNRLPGPPTKVSFAQFAPRLLPRRAGIVAVVPPPFHPQSCWLGLRRMGASRSTTISMCNHGEDRVNLGSRTGESTRFIIKLVPQPGRKYPVQRSEEAGMTQEQWPSGAPNGTPIGAR